MKRQKIKKGFYRIGESYLVQTERYGNDSLLDWVAVASKPEAERLWHGGEIREIEWVGNRLKDFQPNPGLCSNEQQPPRHPEGYNGHRQQFTWIDENPDLNIKDILPHA